MSIIVKEPLGQIDSINGYKVATAEVRTGWAEDPSIVIARGRNDARIGHVNGAGRDF
jgi:hypothetical protein